MTRFLPKAVLAGVFATTLFVAPAISQTTATGPVELVFDATDLRTSDGADRVLAELERQARKACMDVSPLLNSRKVDESCVDDVPTQAIRGIASVELAEAYNLSTGSDIVSLSQEAAFNTTDVTSRR